MGWDANGNWSDEDLGGISPGGGIADQGAAPMAATPVPPQAPPAQLPPPPPALPATAVGPAPVAAVPPTGAHITIAPEQATQAQGANETQAELRKNALAAGENSVQAASDRAAQVDQEHVLRERQRQEAEHEREAQQAGVEAAKARRLRDQEEYQKVRANGIHDPEAEASFGHKLLAGIAMGLGAYSAAMNGGANHAAEIIKGATDRNIMIQRQKIESAKEAAIQSGEDVNTAVREATDANHRLNLKHAAQLDAISQDFKERSARLGIPAARIAADETVLKLDAAKNAADAKALESQRAMTERETAEAHRAARIKAKGAGAAVGGKTGDAAAELAQRISQGTDGRELTMAEKIRAANELGIPLEAKAGHVSLKSINGSIAFDAKAAQAGKKTDLAGERQMSKETQQWAQTNGVNKIATQQRELSGLQKELADNPHNPLLQALAVEKAVSAARGGAASKQALALALGHLGGSLDTADAIISKIRSGEIGPKQMENFSGFIRGQLGNAQKEGKDAYDNFNKFIDTQPPERRKVLEAERGRLFSGFHGFQGGGETRERAAAPAAKVAPSERAAAMLWLQGHPNDPRAAAVKQKLEAAGP